jgi:hypothetical protein
MAPGTHCLENQIRDAEPESQKASSALDQSPEHHSMINFTEMLADLRAHDVLCRELLVVVERESQLLRQTPTPE